MMSVEERFRSTVILESGEEIRRSFRVKPNYLTWSGEYEGYNGFLLVTTRRLLVYRWAMNTYLIEVNLRLGEIREIKTGGIFIRHIIINEHKFFPMNAEPKNLKRFIQEAIETRDLYYSTIELPETIQLPETIELPEFTIQTNQDKKSLKFCPRCEHQNDKDGLFCEKCGSEV